LEADPAIREKNELDNNRSTIPGSHDMPKDD
jgi:hypothetical protein